MKYRVIPTDKFKKQVKRLIKKYASLTTELAALGQTLADRPESGTALGNNTYKIRLAVKAKEKLKAVVSG